MDWLVFDETLFTNDAVVLGLLMGILAFVFATSSSEHPGWRRFYAVVPSLLLCYFIPSVFSTLNVISGQDSELYFVASRYLLPASLVLLTLSIDLQRILRLGPKAVIMFLTGTVGILIGGPLSLLLFSWIAPGVVAEVGAESLWRGMTTVAGSWIGGGANQAAMKEVFAVGDSMFSAMVTVDVIVANVWMACLLIAAGRSKAIDAAVGADASAIEDLKRRIADYQAKIARLPGLADTMIVLAVGFGVTAVSHLVADLLVPQLEALARVQGAPGEPGPFAWLERLSLTSRFFWLIVAATTGGVLLSFTRVRRLEGVGASRLGSVMIYVLVATIGMKMDLLAIFRSPSLFAIGLVWMAIHASLLIGVARAIRAPVFFMAVGSQANVGGAASAPIVAAAFHPALAPVGVLLAVLGYALGTYAAYLCGLLMQAAVG